MSSTALEAEYRSSWRLLQQMGLRAMNCGYLRNADDTFYGHQQSLIWRMLEHTPVGPDSVVLDVGCGIGGPTTWVFERFHPRLTVGLDYCGSSVKAAEASWAGRSPRPYFLQADAHHLPIQSASVDVILSCESALHYRDKIAFLRECRRVLKPAGHLCLADITANSPRVWALLTRLAGGLVRLWSRKQYLAALPACGFEVLWHEQASSPVAAALRAGYAEVARLKASVNGAPLLARDVRRRALFLRGLQLLLRLQALTYDLFTARAR